MQPNLHVGVVGGGLIAQAVHLPNLVSSAGRFTVAAIADPSPKVLAALGAQYAPVATYLDWRDMLEAGGLDALVVCSPQGTHTDVLLAGIELGLPSLVEKPLCITVADGEAIAAAAAAAGVVVQVGYMKRYASAYAAFLDALPPNADALRAIDVMTYDPWMAREPFVPWSRMVAADDIPERARHALAAQEARLVGEAIGDDGPEAIRTFAYTFLGALSHDINLIHGVLDRLGIAAEPVRSAAWAGGDAASATLRLAGGGQWHTTWLMLRGLEDFEERARIFFDGAIHELAFDVPYHVQKPVRHAVTTGAAGGGRRQVELLMSDPYRVELERFHACVTSGAENLTPPEQSVVDLRTLRDLYLRRDRGGA